MIGKIIKSKSFKNLIEYLDKKDAVVLGTNMYGRNNRELTAEFMSVHDLNPGIKQPVLHASLSLSPGESLSNEQFTQACETWIEKMGFDLASNQYLIVRHQDTEHEHAHIAINRIDMVSGLVVADHFDRYRSQEIIRQLEQDYGLEQVAKSWQTFKNQQRNFKPTLELSSHQKLAAEIEQASLGQPTMPEFFQRLANYQIQAELNFTRTGKPYGISYQTAFGEKVSGNALGKAYSFCGLQKYLKVNYDPAKDHLKLVEVIQNAQQPVSRSSTVELTEGLSREEGNLKSPTINLEDRQLSYEGLGADYREKGNLDTKLISLNTNQSITEGSPFPFGNIPNPPLQTKCVTPQEHESHSSQPLPEPVENLPPIQQKIPHVWEPQYGIPNIEKLIEAIPTKNTHNSDDQFEQAKASYQHWVKQAQAIYQITQPRDIDQRIAFLMQQQQQQPNQITLVLAHSPAMQELRKRDHTYVQNYSQFCQSTAHEHHYTWQLQKEEYLKAMEIERQQKEQQRIAAERERLQQQQRQRYLKLLAHWEQIAIALGRPGDYVEKIQQITDSYERGLPLSKKAIEACVQDTEDYHRQIQAQTQRRSRGLRL